MGSLTLGGAVLESLDHVMPARTLFSLGREDCSGGSGRPSISQALPLLVSSAGENSYLRVRIDTALPPTSHGGTSL